MIQLRPYQQEAVAAVYDHLRTRDDNPCVVIPTAGGKTPILATICKDAVGLWGGRVLILAHVKELLEQTASKLEAICPEVPYGIYSAGLKRRETGAPVIVAGIQSVYQRAGELDAFDLILIDEAHLIPPDGEGMYRSFLADAKLVNPAVRVVGLTATPYRMRTGSICTPDGILNHVCYEVGVRELVIHGYLCRPTTRIARAEVNTDDLHVRAGEYVADEVEDLMDTDELVRAACAELVEATRDRQSVLIFASGVRHGEHLVVELMNSHEIDCGMVTDETDDKERAAILEDFREGRLKYLCNVNVLTTGFDAPRIDCVAIMRPTLSPGLYYQMVGRGFRLHPDKRDVLVLDYGNNVQRHGPVDKITAKARKRRGDEDAPEKLCPQCRTMVAAGFATCPECGAEFPPPEDRATHAARASEAAVLSSQQEQPKPQRHPVLQVKYRVHTKKGHQPGDGTPQTLRVDYQIGMFNWVSEWVCIEHDGFALQKAATWWGRRSPLPMPRSAARAAQLAEFGVLAEPLAVEVATPPGERFERVVGYELGPIPNLTGVEIPAPEPEEEETPNPTTWRPPVTQHSALFDAYTTQSEAADEPFPFGANVRTPFDALDNEEDIPF